ncbi:flagellar protein FlaG [Lysinibacillus sp. FJAT-14745]|uniref:flagellar protein FlaG n=1 Tax=Lysinibacillus sp. FJAT-14745 TaxID=1704289 RepID=UPI0006ABD95B|nr:flagellar protein FlaG [Lysinibacillus sp. FJAT-14745]KOP77734.1 flagellar protein FlaG [Lysinibacillus sp. FJAT-14745]
MRISGNIDIDSALISDTSVPKIAKEESNHSGKISIATVEPEQQLDNSEETKAKVRDVVDKMNEMLEVTHSASKFMYHEGLERYYVTVINEDTNEVIKEIPPKKLLDAFYEMQKLLGMIVDEKI